MDQLGALDLPAFAKLLSPRDRKILQLEEGGSSPAQIAAVVGKSRGHKPKCFNKGSSIDSPTTIQREGYGAAKPVTRAQRVEARQRYLHWAAGVEVLRIDLEDTMRELDRELKAVLAGAPR